MAFYEHYPAYGTLARAELVKRLDPQAFRDLSGLFQQMLLPDVAEPLLMEASRAYNVPEADLLRVNEQGHR